MLPFRKTFQFGLIFALILPVILNWISFPILRLVVRVTPVEGRTQELEETTRRNTQDIRGVDDRLTKRIDDVNGLVDRAQASADSANTRAIAADERAARADDHAGRAETRVEDLRSNLDPERLSVADTKVLVHQRPCNNVSKRNDGAYEDDHRP